MDYNITTTCSRCSQELYCISSKFDKLNVSKAIVASIREFGGHFLQIKNGLHYEIGDKRSWDKTSQALREGQTEIRASLEEDEARLKANQRMAGLPTSDATVANNLVQYKQIISEKGFLEYSRRVLESLHTQRDDFDGNNTQSLGPFDCQNIGCPNAKRRKTTICDERTEKQRVLALNPQTVNTDMSSEMPREQSTKKQIHEDNLIVSGSLRFQASTWPATMIFKSEEIPSMISTIPRNEPSRESKERRLREDEMTNRTNTTSLQNNLDCADCGTFSEAGMLAIERNLSDEIDDLIQRHSSALSQIESYREDLSLEDDENNINKSNGKKLDETDSDI